MDNQNYSSFAKLILHPWQRRRAVRRVVTSALAVRDMWAEDAQSNPRSIYTRFDCGWPTCGHKICEQKRAVDALREAQ